MASQKLDVSLWVYLLALNWAAVDLIIHTRSIRLLYEANLAGEGDPWTRKAASIGATMTIVLWGTQLDNS